MLSSFNVLAQKCLLFGWLMQITMSKFKMGMHCFILFSKLYRFIIFYEYFSQLSLSFYKEMIIKKERENYNFLDARALELLSFTRYTFLLKGFSFIPLKNPEFYQLISTFKLTRVKQELNYNITKFFSAFQRFW